MVKADFFAVSRRGPKWGQVVLPVEGLWCPMVEAADPCAVVLVSSQALRVFVGAAGSDVYGQPLGFRYPNRKSELGAGGPLTPCPTVDVRRQWDPFGSWSQTVQGSRELLIAASFLNTASFSLQVPGPRFSEAPALFLPLKTRLCGTDFPVAGRRQEAAGPSACLQDKEAHCYSLSTQRLSGPDKRAWHPGWQRWMGIPALAPRTHCPSVYPSPWDQPNQMAAYGAITQSFSCARGRQECEVSQRI